MDSTTALLWKKAFGIQDLPDNMAEFLMVHASTLEISVCHTDVENGYGSRITRLLQVKLPYRKCNRCGYHSLWNPDDTNSHCMRHTYEKGWDTVFAYDPDNNFISLPDAFSEWLSKQPTEWIKPTKKGMYLGKGVF